MRVVINGEAAEVPDGLDLRSLLEYLSLPDRRIAVELDKQVVSRADWQATLVSEGARIEIVHFVGGG